MALASGAKLGPYEIQSPIGAGGMGEVYRARDSRLNRDVAVKILSSTFARDPERLRRFQQEAQAIAALNHPNILAVHDFGQHDGSLYMVTELLEGETLRERLRSSLLPARKATEYAEHVARGLAAAHDKGIVHRDLKPENIFVTHDGRVKILDFGLAKLARLGGTVTSDSETVGLQTEPGMLMGTVGYMSPEQVKGQAADHRSDLFSFGAILYEMLVGKRAFDGGTAVEAMNAILKEDPPEPTGTNRSVPPLLDRIVHHCLEKNPEERFQSAHDVAFALGAVLDSSKSAVAGVTVATSQPWRRWLRFAAEVALLGVAVGLLLTRHTSETPGLAVQAAILPPPGDGFWANITQPAAISPNGRFIAIVAMRNGHAQLWLRRVDAADAQPVAGSEDASNPFWSPDSRYVAFFVPGKLRKVDTSGSAITDICPSGAFGMGGAWSKGGVIIFATFGEALRKVSDKGGAPESIAGTELSSDAVAQIWPTFLPDGNHFLYLDWRYSNHEGRENGVWIGSLDGEKARRLPLTSTNVSYSEGYLLFSRDGDLVAQKFDLSRLQLGESVLPIARNIQYDTFFHDGMFTVSANGTLVYGIAGSGVNTQLAWMDRDGRVLGSLGEPGQFERQSISPDGTRVAVGVKFCNASERIWIYDVERGTRIPIVNSESGPTLYGPVWSPDGKQVAYRNTLGKTSSLVAHNSDGSGVEREPGSIHFELLSPTDWSPDGRYLALDLTKFQGSQNWQDSLRIVGVDGAGQSVLDINDASAGRFSPDGHWLAYADENSGQVYVTSFPGPGPRIAVSTAGGGEPRWRGDGQELFYVTDDLTLISVQVRESAHDFRALSSHPLFRFQLPWNVGYYDVTRDGKRFLVNTRTLAERTVPLTVVTNWRELVQRESRN